MVRKFVAKIVIRRPNCNICNVCRVELEVYFAIFVKTEKQAKKQNMEQRSVKQVIVMRRDLNMRKGKMVAQGAHASLGALLQLMRRDDGDGGSTRLSLEYARDSFVGEWLDGMFAKVCLYVDSEKDLVNLYRKVKEQKPDMPCELVRDAGLTEFHGVPTLTCLAIGPYWSDEINKFTCDLKLL